MFSDDQSLNLGLSFLPSSTSNLKVPNDTYHVQIKDNRTPGEAPLLTLSLELSAGDMFPGAEQPGSAASSDSNNTSLVRLVKRERQESSDHEEEDDRAAGPTSSTTRKKLRLTKKQSLFLEDTFKQHTTLNPKQKQVLADQLSLRPRQIEVWFQNRRARTKLKQTEVECEQMKKYCDTLTDENRRLQKELQDLKTLKIGQPGLYMHLPAATLATCPSCCQRTGSGSGATLPVPINLGSKAHFYPSYPNPSAAC